MPDSNTILSRCLKINLKFSVHILSNGFAKYVHTSSLLYASLPYPVSILIASLLYSTIATDAKLLTEATVFSNALYESGSLVLIFKEKPGSVCL